MGRLAEGVDRGVVLGAAGVQRDRPARRPQFAHVAAGQVRADHLPRIAFVDGTEDHVAAGVEHVRVVRREEDRVGPREAVARLAHAAAVQVFRPDIDELNLAVAAVGALERALPAGRRADRAHVDDVHVVGLDRDVAALARAHHLAVGPGDGPGDGVAGHADAGVVLLRAVDAVREFVVHVHVVELGGGLVVDRAEGLRGVEGDAGAAVVAFDQPAVVARVDPEVMVVAVGRRNFHEGFAAVGGLVHAQVEHVDRILVLRVGVDVHVVPGAAEQVGVVGELLPGRAKVVGAVEAGRVLRLDDGPDAARLHRRGGHADLALERLREALVQADLLPGVAAVQRTPQAAVRAAAAQFPEVAIGLPDAGVDDVGVLLVDAQVHGAGALALEEHLFPGDAAVA
jgi:hypothetical protein